MNKLEQKKRISNLFYVCSNCPPKGRAVYHRVSHDPLKHPALLENLINKQLLTEDLCQKCEKEQRRKSMEFWKMKNEEIRIREQYGKVWEDEIEWRR